MTQVLGLCVHPDGTRTVITYHNEGMVSVAQVADVLVCDVRQQRVYPKLSTDEYSFIVTQHVGRRAGDRTGFDTVLRQHSTGKTKTFFNAVGDLVQLISHMNSLTDDLCSQWFSERVKKSKTPKTEPVVQ